MKSTSLLAGFLASAAVCSVGCSKSADRPDQNWTSPVSISSSIDGLGGAIRLHRYHDTLIGVQVLYGGSAQLFILNRASNSWSQSNVTSMADAGGWMYLWGFASFDSQNKRVLVPEGYAENEQLVMKILMGTVEEDLALRDITEKEWTTEKKRCLEKLVPT